MKKSIYILTLIIIFLSACKKDDKKDITPIIIGNNNNGFNNVPSGTIVPYEERLDIITQSADITSEDRYWMIIESKAFISGCGQNVTQDNLEGYENDTLEILFNSDYTFATRLNGTPQTQGTWSWEDDQTREGIILNSYPTIIFTFTMLNDSEIVYASNQDQSNETCDDISVITFEHLIESTYSGEGGGNPPETLFTSGSGVIDIDGNTYQTIVFNNGYEWMAENLRTTKYRNGNSIFQVTDNTEWSDLTSGAWVYYENSSFYEYPYGKLYNAYAAQDSRGICPTGWHVPSNSEVQTLASYLGGISIAGAKMKETGTVHWYSPNTGATNESGFNGLPGGSRYIDGDFMTTMGNQGWWWTSVSFPPYAAYSYSLQAHNTELEDNIFDNTMGFSVRCVKN